MSQCSGYKFGIVWSELKHSGLMSTPASRSTSSSRQPFSTADFRHCAMMLGVMEESYCREVCFSLPGWGSHIGGGALVSLRPALVRVVSDVRFPHFSCFGSDGPLSAPLVCTAATHFINETSVLFLVEGVEHVPSFRLSDRPRRTAAIFRRERRVLRLRLMLMPIRSDCALSRYLDQDGVTLVLSSVFWRVCLRPELRLTCGGSPSKKPLLSFCVARRCMRYNLQHLTDHDLDKFCGSLKAGGDTTVCDTLRSLY